MQRNTATSAIYLITATAGSLFELSRNSQGTWPEFLIFWRCVAAAPLLFVFAYPRWLLAETAPRRCLMYGLISHIVGAASAGVLFSIFSPYWKNPVRDPGESIFLLLVQLTVLVVFLVAAISLLLRNKSGLATLASVLIWPYCLVSALVFEDRFYQDSGLYVVCYFLCFITPVFFAFAAGTIFFQPRLAHAIALLGVLAIPSIYLTLRDSGMGNAWLLFNQPDNRFAFYPPYALFGIFFVALFALAIVTAGLRLLPTGWLLRGSPVSDRTWPALVVSLAVMIVWFCESVMPYRIPGALDYSGWPVLQILHVQKRGLQFHETCVSIDGFKFRNNYQLQSVNFSGDDRRLLRYRFKKRVTSGQLSEPIRERVRAMLASANQAHAPWAPIKPVRNWDADNWYVLAQGGGLKAYISERGSLPPPEIVDLFNDLEKLPHASESQSEFKDVCLGFCYDPLSALGYLYANHRCFNNGHGVVCR